MLIFTYFMLLFVEKNVLIWNNKIFSLIFLSLVLLVLYLKKILPDPRTWRFILMFPSTSFILWLFPLGLPWDNFCVLCEVRIQVCSLGCGYQVVQTQFVEKTIFPLLNFRGTLIKNQLTINVWSHFWTLNFFLLSHISALMPVPHRLDYCSFVVSFENEMWDSINVSYFYYQLVCVIFLAVKMGKFRKVNPRVVASCPINESLELDKKRFE